MRFGGLLKLRFVNHFFLSTRKMSIFLQNTNPMTGVVGWEEKDPDYDYYQEIARSAFADMLHDHERNYKYYLGLKAAINAKHAAGEKAHVLDIGTGTGLLSMMAAKLGADSIVACEAFKPMAECATKIMKENGFGEKIELIYKRSTKLTVGENGDLKHRANILVTEVFDTELIGEGALSTFKHAQEVLLDSNPIVIPSSATVYAQVIDSSLVKGWNRVNCIKDKISSNELLKVPKCTQSCSGASAVHDIQLSQLPYGSFTPLSEAIPIYQFDWTGKVPLKFNENAEFSIKPINKGTAHAVFIWWDIVMDMHGEVLLSCAPVWNHPDVQEKLKKQKNYEKLVDEIPWRDHWMQAVYYLPNDLNMHPETEVYLTASHDEYSFWFSLNENKGITNTGLDRPVCECYVHLALSRTRIGQWNNESRNQKYLQAIQNKVRPDATCLCLSDSSLLGLSIANMNIKKLYILETKPLSKRTIEMFINANNLEEKVSVIDSVDKLPAFSEFDLIFGEPYFVTSILPWDNFYFWYLISKDSKNIPRIPEKAVIKGVAVEFRDLHKIRAPLGICEGFDMTMFDDLVKSSSDKTDSTVEAQPLWEYPGKALTEAFSINSFDFCQNVEKSSCTESQTIIRFSESGSCNGIALWVDWHLDQDNEIVVSSGPIVKIIPGERLSWDPYTRQGVHLPYEIKNVSSENSLRIRHKFNPKEGTMHFNFEIISDKDC
ncbi:protein arginine N-methyltransferase 7 isoform X1 [Trichogramma pretiosum]|uniref:protein arginine N-methyltransferase 7 isoform X1 n=1 Tax=Trichogramma pretiosum TaxID=7493 RepID=UPI0006C990B9|nr:protein arginine N-methyltransferase 7 isoform X1 [Trichogramma pretiosum]